MCDSVCEAALTANYKTRNNEEEKAFSISRKVIDVGIHGFFEFQENLLSVCLFIMFIFSQQLQ